MRVMLLGATGLVGGLALPRLLDDPRCSGVVAPTRRPLGMTHGKLENPILAFDALPAAPEWARVDAVICALGSTIAQAGSREAFHRIDHDYPLAFARLAQAQGAQTYVLNSAAGANPQSSIFYSRVKGELERDLRALGFHSLTLVRPGLIGGEQRGASWRAPGPDGVGCIGADVATGVADQPGERDRQGTGRVRAGPAAG